jgi:hypothetical protein
METSNRAMEVVIKYSRWGNFLLSLLAVCFVPAHVLADPPARVGRVNYESGSVSFRPAALGDWTSAFINRPVTTGDELWTDNDSRAELHIGSAAIRLDQDTDFQILNLDDNITQIRLTEGSINLHLRQLSERESIEIDTPNASVSLLRAGEYRIDVEPDGNHTQVTVKGGQSEVTANDSAFTVYAQQTGIITGADQPAYEVQNAASPDSWDNWCAARDQRQEQTASLRYVSRETIGYEDLDDYGFWRVYPGYGAVWIPTTGVPVGWAPYRYGHWVWIEPWGWTWIDDAPWGFAPFHYGRWAIVDGTWAWIPGRIIAHPVYAPALVAFIGGEHFRLSVAFGSMLAWFPLGPGEVYMPAYRVSPTYIRQVNITNVNITNINVTNYNVTNVKYVNRTVPGAVTAVSREDFVSAHSIAKTSVKVPPATLAAAQATTNLAVPPRKESLLGHSLDTSRFVIQPPAAAVNRVVVARKTPPSIVPFASHKPAGPTKDDASLKVTQTTPAQPNVKVVSPRNAAPAHWATPIKSGIGASSTQPVKTSNSSSTSAKSVDSTKPVGLQPAAKNSVVIDDRKKTVGTSVSGSKSTKSAQSTDSAAAKSESKTKREAKDKAKKKSEEKQTNTSGGEKPPLS